MLNKSFNRPIATFAVALVFGYSNAAQAQSTKDDFTKASDANPWKTFGGACLTAGDGTGNIPACIGLPYYTEALVGGTTGKLPDSPGSGALRFTNGAPGGFKQAGAIISSGNPFPTSQGVQVIFKTVTYRGDSGGAGKDGADGMGFFLMDGTYPPYDVGAFGGSLGYTCSNTNNDVKTRNDNSPRAYDGLAGGYLGLGIDEYGNFLNKGDNTNTGPAQVPGRVGLRGAGSITWAELNKKYPAQYPLTLLQADRANAVKDTCRTGVVWDYSKAIPAATAITIDDYALIPGANALFSALYPGKLIANETALTRNDKDVVPITYNLKITQDGLLSLSMSYGGGNYVSVIKKQSITAQSGALPTSFRFGFTGSTGGSSNIHEIMCFQAAPADLGDTSVGINAKEAAKIANGTQAYLAYYYPSSWTGRLTASNILYNSSTQAVTVSVGANWDADCNLTGVSGATSCISTGKAGPILPQSPTPTAPGTTPPGRTILTWDGSQGVAFEWAASTSGSAITTPQRNTLDLGDVPPPINANRLNYLRGDRSNELTSIGVGLYRIRDSVLGDIVDSSPTWVGPPVAPYSIVWNDKVLGAADVTPENSGQTYSNFLAAAQTRLNVVYAGSNDGFLHGFRSGSFDKGGVFMDNASTPNDGIEVLAYMPGSVLQTIHNAIDPTLDFSNAQYAHNFFVDATPDADDLYYNNAWHTWLVGGLGSGGATIYALDVTDPSQFTETNAKKIVVGEWNSSNISCVSNGGCGNNLGSTYGTPVVRRLHDGRWGIIFGNGFGSASGDAGIYIMTVNPTSGIVDQTYYLSTGKKGSNGIAFVTPMDLDGDYITDYVYAGDLLGNVWRFDLTSGTENSWSASSSPLFVAPSGQPITTRLLVAIARQTGGLPRVMVDFGTGHKIPQTNTLPAQYQPGVEYLYGIWDWNMGNWNSKLGSQFASLVGPYTITDATLQAQNLSVAPDGISRDITNYPVCWQGSTVCVGGNTQFGFEVALPASSEQIIFNPLQYQNNFVVNTTIPTISSPTSCQVNHETGYTIAISLSTGGLTGGKSAFKNTNDTNTAGAYTNGIGTPLVVQAGGGAFLLTQSLGDGDTRAPGDSTHAGAAMGCTQQIGGTNTCSGGFGGSPVGRRVTWIQRR